MTPQQIEAMKLALEALKWCHGGEPCGTAEAITALEEALAQPEQEPVRVLGFNCVCGRRMEVSAEQGVTLTPRQKPVAWGVFDGLNLHDMFFTEEEAQEMVRLKGDGSNVKLLYTTPPQRTWVGLTLTQVKLLWEGVQEEAIKSGDSVNWVFYTHINEALKEKNT